MSGFLERVAARALGTAALASPRIGELFAALDPPTAVPSVVESARAASDDAQPTPTAVARNANGSKLQPRASARQPETADAAQVSRAGAVAVSVPAPRRAPTPQQAPLVPDQPDHRPDDSSPVPTRRNDSLPPRVRPQDENTVVTHHHPPAFKPLVDRQEAPARYGTAAPWPHADGAPSPQSAIAAAPSAATSRDETTVHINIGRIEVRTRAPAAPPARNAPVLPRPGVSLQDYLRRGSRSQ